MLPSMFSLSGIELEVKAPLAELLDVVLIVIDLIVLSIWNFMKFYAFLRFSDLRSDFFNFMVHLLSSG